MVSIDHQSSSSTLRSRTNASSRTTTPTTSLASTSSISSIDDETHELEFGGAPGTLAMMIGFPILFYYLYVCIFFNHGKSLSPFSLSLWSGYWYRVCVDLAQLAIPSNPYTLMGNGGWWEFIKYISSLVYKVITSLLPFSPAPEAPLTLPWMLLSTPLQLTARQPCTSPS